MSVTFEEVMDFHPGNRDVYEEIRDSLGQLMPFVGAGLTADVYGTWGGALRELGGKLTDTGAVGELDGLLASGRYFEAADLLKKRRGASNFEQDLVHHFSPSRLDEGGNWDKVQKGAIWLLPDLFACPVLTTNFDQAIELVYRRRGHEGFESLDPLSQDIRGKATRLMRRPCVFKLHGTVTDPVVDSSRIVFTKAQYDEHYGPVGDAREALSDFIDRRALLFLGCSLRDDATVDVLKDAAGPGVTHYAIVSCGRDERDERIRELAEAGIRVIVYEDGRHESVRTVLERLLCEVPATRGGVRRGGRRRRAHSFWDALGAMLICACRSSVLTMMPIVLGLVFLTVPHLPFVAIDGLTVSAEPIVYASDIVPHTKWGGITRLGELTGSVSASVDADKAFTINAFLRCHDPESSRLEFAACDVLRLAAIDEAVMIAHAGVCEGDLLLVHAVNNGWGTEEVSYDVYGLVRETGCRAALDDFCAVVEDRTGARTYEPGRIARLVKGRLDHDWFESTAGETGGKLTLDIYARGNGGETSLLKTIEFEDGAIRRVTTGTTTGITAGNTELYLFRTLPVEKCPSVPFRLRFPDEESTQMIEDKFHVAMRLAPTRSCDVRCRGVYSVDGTVCHTEEYDVTVTVPYYSDNLLEFDADDQNNRVRYHTLFSLLDTSPEADEAELNAAAEAFRFDPASVDYRKERED